MLLPRIVKRMLHRNGWEQRTYSDLRQLPVAHMVSLQIAAAVRDHATRITWGLPPGVELTDADAKEIRARHEEIGRCIPEDEESLHESGDQSASCAERREPVGFHRRDGLPEVPLWLKVNGQWYRSPGFPVQLFAFVPQHLSELLVALEADRGHDHKADWIEYTTAVGGEFRMFVRVDLIFEPSNSVTLELLESRIEKGNTTVWWRHGRV